MKRHDRRSDCPINFVLQTVGDSWSLLLVRDLMFTQKRSYSEFAASEERISSNILADRLRRLTTAGVIRKEGSGRGTRYYLTAKGLDLLPVMLEMIRWSGRYDADTAAPPSFLDRLQSEPKVLAAEIEDRLRVSHGLTAVA
jgi:DNA-binding HxlR family transcriptional regulator